MFGNLRFRLIICSVVGLHVFFFGFGQSSVILVGEWKMEEGGGGTLLDHSGLGNKGTLVNENDVLWDAGKDELALFLPGSWNRFAIVPHKPSLDITDEISIAAWISPTEVRNATILGTTDPDGYELSISKSGQIEFKFNSQTYGSTYRLRSNATYPSDGTTWMHVVATYDGEESKIYVDGLIDAAVTFSNPVPINSNASDLYIGSLQGSRRWKGGLDEVKLYRGVLNASEIQSLAFLTQSTEPTLSSVTISSSNIASKLAKPGDIITLTFEASEPINTPAVKIAAQSVKATAGANNNFFASYTMANTDDPGVVPFSIEFSSTSGTAGDPVTATTDGSQISFDKTPPSISTINRQNPSTVSTNASSVTFRAIFSEDVIGVSTSGFVLVLTNDVYAEIDAVSPVSGSIYDVQLVNVTGTGELGLDLVSEGAGITDVAGNEVISGFTGGQIFQITGEIPAITFVSLVSNNVMPTLARPTDLINLTFEASGPIDVQSVSIATHSVHLTQGDNYTYNASYSLTNLDEAGSVPFVIEYKAPGDPAVTEVTSTTNGTAVDFDNAAPFIVSIDRESPSSNPTGLQAVIFQVTFSEAVTGVDVADFSLSTSGDVTAVISSVRVASVCGCVSVYDVSVSSINGTGTLRLNLKGSSTGITDPAGNEIVGGYTEGQSYSIQQEVYQTGFQSVIGLTPFNITKETKDKPQAKVWKYANQWWCVLSESGSTRIFRLNGSTWTSVLNLINKNSKPDCIVAGDLVHILCVKDVSLFYTVQYDQANNSYKLWDQQPVNPASSISLPPGNQTATIAKDGTGRIWLASDGRSEIYVWWSDAPYTSWSAPVTIASGVKDDDICTLTALPSQNKIGIFWSNQTTRRFGFRFHEDGADPATWSTDEVPSSHSAMDVGKGMADNHMSVQIATDGTLYCAAKTGYDSNNYPHLVLLIRRPSGTWDDMYTVTNYSDGTQPILLYNEVRGKLKVVYTSVTNGGSIVYRESTVSNISFGMPKVLMNSSNVLYNFATSTHQTYNPDIVVMATDVTSTPKKAVSVLASDVRAEAPSLITIFSSGNEEPNYLKPDPNSFIETKPNLIVSRIVSNPQN